MAAKPLTKTIVGYAVDQSVSPDESIRFCVSGEGGGRYQAEIHRLLGGGFDPDGPELKTEPMKTVGDFPLLDQGVTPGSYATATLVADLSVGSIVVNVCQTRSAGEQGLVTLEGENGETACLGLRDGHPFGSWNGGCAGGEIPIAPGAWSRLVLSWEAGQTSLWVETGDGWTRQSVDAAPDLGLTARLTLGAVPGPQGPLKHFSGRLERPAVLASSGEGPLLAGLVGPPGDPTPAEAVALWEFCQGMDRWVIPGQGSHDGPLELHQAPVRAVRGSTWTEGSVDWREVPFEYAAMQFHPDALEDCGWEPQPGWLVPADAQSGFYALHVTRTNATADSGVADDWIPFFVRPTDASRARTLVIASSATYAAYSNSRFWWEDPIQEIAQDRLVELGPEEQYLVVHPELGLSNYDRHLDGSPVVFSSRRRPNLFMRPGHSRAESYASDLYLIAWLEHRGLEYDVATDEDLHFQGHEILQNYEVAISGSHPEYISVPMYDHLRTWIESGGRFVYLGGNGFTSNVTWSVDKPWLMENRATGRMQNDELTSRTEAFTQTDGTLGAGMGESGRSAGSLWGVDSVTMGFDRSYPVLRSNLSYAAEFAWAFDGISTRLFGGRSLSGGGVVGQEWDNARNMVGTPGHYVLASSHDHSLIPIILGVDEPHHADLVLFYHGSGVVFSASSMAWAGALYVQDYTNDAERLTRNIVERFLDPAPISMPAEQ